MKQNIAPMQLLLSIVERGTAAKLMRHYETYKVTQHFQAFGLECFIVRIISLRQLQTQFLQPIHPNHRTIAGIYFAVICGVLIEAGKAGDCTAVGGDCQHTVLGGMHGCAVMGHILVDQVGDIHDDLLLNGALIAGAVVVSKLLNEVRIVAAGHHDAEVVRSHIGGRANKFKGYVGLLQHIRIKADAVRANTLALSRRHRNPIGHGRFAAGQRQLHRLQFQYRFRFLRRNRLLGRNYVLLRCSRSRCGSLALLRCLFGSRSGCAAVLFTAAGCQAQNHCSRQQER